MTLPSQQSGAMGPKRSVRLRVIGGSVELRGDVPATRSECPTQRPCPHVKCKWHLWLIDGRDRPGRRFLGRHPASTLRPVWLEWPLPPSCGAEIIEIASREEWTRAQIAAACGISVDALVLALQVVKAKLRAAAKIDPTIVTALESMR